jgi:DNA-binding helix-hairpin-helix protein with protein kinase domain
LESFGVMTAADVLLKKLYIPGFGPVLREAVLDWRKTCESRFVYDKTKGIDPADISVLNRRYEHRRRELEDKLQKGANELARLRAEIIRERQVLHPRVLAAGRILQQAQANFTAIQN